MFRAWTLKSDCLGWNPISDIHSDTSQRLRKVDSPTQRNFVMMKWLSRKYIAQYMYVRTQVMSLWVPMDCSPPGSSVHGISQTRTLECIAIPFSRGSSQPRDWTLMSKDWAPWWWPTSCASSSDNSLLRVCSQPLSQVCLFATPWAVACKVPLSMGFSRQGYWSGLPSPSPADLLNIYVS